MSRDKLLGVGVWIGGVWNGHFPESEEHFSETEICRKSPFNEFQAPDFEVSEPQKMQFHTPSHSIPPLASLLIAAKQCMSLTAGVTKISTLWDAF